MLVSVRKEPTRNVRLWALALGVCGVLCAFLRVLNSVLICRRRMGGLLPIVLSEDVYNH